MGVHRTRTCRWVDGFKATTPLAFLFYRLVAVPGNVCPSDRVPGLRIQGSRGVVSSAPPTARQGPRRGSVHGQHTVSAPAAAHQAYEEGPRMVSTRLVPQRLPPCAGRQATARQRARRRCPRPRCVWCRSCTCPCDMVVAATVPTAPLPSRATQWARAAARAAISPSRERLRACPRPPASYGRCMVFRLRIMLLFACASHRIGPPNRQTS